MALAGIVWAAAGFVFAQDYPHAFPRQGAEKILENDRVIVWDATWRTTCLNYHRHRYDLTGVFLRWGPLRVTRLDGTFTASATPFEFPASSSRRRGSLIRKRASARRSGTPS